MTIRSVSKALAGKLMTALVLALLVTAAGAAEPDIQPAGSPTIKRSLGRPPLPCPPPCPPLPLPPLPPVNPSVPPGDPSVPPAVQPATPPVGSPAAGTRGGTADALDAAPNLFGDLLGGRSAVTSVQPRRPGFLNNKTVVVAAPATGTAPGTVSGDLGNGTVSLRDATGRNLVSVPSIRVTGLPGALSNPTALRSLGVQGAFTEVVPVGTNVIYTPTGTNAANAEYVRRYFEGSSAQRPAGATIVIPADIPFGAGRDQIAAPIERAVNPQATLAQLSLGPVQAVFTGSELRYMSTITDTITTPAVLLSIPNPGTGGVVGLLKLSEDNNPLPRDRVIFNYDYFDNVPFTPTGIPVNRYQVGFETTFLDGWTSFEMRLPFASTLNSDGSIGSTGTNTEFGNIRLAAKALLLRRDQLNVSVGLGVYLPTADDLRIRRADGGDLIRVDNTSVQLATYVAALWTPNERLFAQGWIGGSFDTGGNRVTVDPATFGGTGRVGDLRAGNLLLADIQVGYWLHRADTGLLQGLAPFAELHYNGMVTNGNVLSAGNGVFIGDTGGSFNELNLSAGLIAQLGDNTNVSVGAAAPLRTGQNRTFDYQIGVRVNWYFGYTARQKSSAARVNTF